MTQAEALMPLTVVWHAGAMQVIHQQMKGWVNSALGQVNTWFDSPAGKIPEGRCVNLYLLELGPSLNTFGAKVAPIQFTVRFLVTAWGQDVAQSNDDLCCLGFSSIDTPAFEADFEPLSVSTWTAFGIAPRPAFTVRFPLRKERPARPTSMVRSPLVFVQSPMTTIEGTVVGPSEVPIAGARVELLTLGLATQTDRAGRFRFAGVPAGHALRFRVLAKGVEQEFAPGLSSDPEHRLQLSLTL